MKIINIKSKLEYHIDIFKLHGEERMKCPECSENRKNKKAKCFSWNIEKQVGHCSHCGESFALYKERVKEYKKPEWKNNTNLSERVVKWFEKRCISQFTLRHAKITEGLEYMPQVEKEVNTIQFNYFRNNELVNIKFRDGAKNFKLYKDAELIVYNYDEVKDSDTVVIVEGEIDCLSMQEAGINYCISVPNGATEKTINLEYIDNCIELFINKKIIIATDNDLPGINLRNELASRLGIENCKRVDFKDCKDANEFLIKYGKSVLNEAVIYAKEFPIEGIFSSSDFSDEIDLLYEYGLQKGLTIGLNTLDELISYDYGRVYTFTGIPGHGKSEVVDQICVNLNNLHGLRIAYFSPENTPMQLHFSKICEKIVGKCFNSHNITKDELEEAKIYFNDNFFIINPEENYTVETILSRARHLVKTKGIKILVIDPYNTLEHNRGNETEHEYVSKFMDILKNFAKRNNIIIFLVAHPRKIAKINGNYEIPNMYDISGSSNFYNKTDFGISVYRNFTSGLTEIYVQKVKFKHLGNIGTCNLSWNANNGRYSWFNDGVWINDDRNYLIKEKEIEIADTISKFEKFDTNITNDIPF